MMKKKYITPKVSVITYSTRSLLAGSLQKIETETGTQYSKESNWSDEFKWSKEFKWNEEDED